MWCIKLTAEARDATLVISDYAKGFGGRYGVEADRMDKVHLEDFYYAIIICVALTNSCEIVTLRKLQLQETKFQL